MNAHIIAYYNNGIKQTIAALAKTNQPVVIDSHISWLQVLKQRVASYM